MIDEGVIKFQQTWENAEINPGVPGNDLIRCRQELFAAGLIGHDSVHNVDFGNMSTRADTPSQFIITGTQTGHIESLESKHLSLVTGWDLAKNSLYAKGLVQASSESLSHAAFYEISSDIGAVVHIHCTTSWQQLLECVPTTPKSIAYGTPAMAFELQRLYKESELGNNGIAAMAGHEGGLIYIGATIAEATARALASAAHQA